MAEPELIVYDGRPRTPKGNTPFAFFDDDADFQTEAPKVAEFIARQLGYPIMDVELKDSNIYACFEEAIVEYGNQINQFRARDHQLTLLGRDSSISMTGQPIIGTSLTNTIKLSQEYATEAEVGGPVELKRGFITASRGTGSYDLNALFADPYEAGKQIEIRSVYHHLPPASIRFYSPFHGGFHVTGDTSGFGTDLLDVSEGLTGAFGGVGGVGGFLSTSFIMFPAYEDLLRIQAIELNDKIRRSNYSFMISNNIIHLSPVPAFDFIVWFEYYLVEDKTGQSFIQTNPSASGSLVSDFSNLPFDNIAYANINSVGRAWIYKYTLALAKEMLGRVRSKYEHIPIPDDQIRLDGDLLLREAADEKKALVEEIRETLEETSAYGQLKKEAEAVKHKREILAGAPLRIYVF